MSALRQRNDFLRGWVRVGLPKCLLLINAFSRVIICGKQMNSSECLWAGESLSWNHDIVEVWHWAQLLPQSLWLSMKLTDLVSSYSSFCLERSLHHPLHVFMKLNEGKEICFQSKSKNKSCVLCKKLWFSQASAGLALLGLSKICQSELTQIRFLTR